MREKEIYRLMVEASANNVGLEADGNSVRVIGDSGARKAILERWREFILANKGDVLEVLKRRAEGKVNWLAVADAILEAIEEAPPSVPVEYQDDWWYFLVDGLGALAEGGIDWELYDKIAEAVAKGKRFAMLEKAWNEWKKCDRARQAAIDASDWDLAYEKGEEAYTWALRGLMVELAKTNGPGVRETNLRTWVYRPYADWLWSLARSKKKGARGA